jgi:hypothetical protein
MLRVSFVFISDTGIRKIWLQESVIGGGIVKQVRRERGAGAAVMGPPGFVAQTDLLGAVFAKSPRSIQAVPTQEARQAEKRQVQAQMLALL